MSRKTRKYSKNQHKDCNKNAKKATQQKCLMKTCRAKKYQSVYGSIGGSSRITRNLFF